MVLLIASSLLWRDRNRVPVIAVVPETTAQEIWESEHTGAAQAARQFGWSVYWNAPVREDDFQRQIRIVEQSVARHVDGLVLAPDHAIALISPVRIAVAHHIPTVVVASPLGIAPGEGLRYVLNDEAVMGKLAAQRAARLLQDGDTVVVIGINPGLLASVGRAEAFEQTLRALRPGVKIEERSIRSASAAEAEETAEEAIRSNPRLRVIVALNVYQSRSAFGALQATGQLSKIALIACDQDLDLLHHLRSGGIDAVLAQDTRTMGAIAIQTIHAMQHGQPTQAQQMVEPLLITRENVDSDRVQQVLNMDWTAGR